MDPTAFLKGALIGFSIAAPVGPIGVLCIRRTLADGRVVGLATGLGAAAADATYGLVAGLGLTAVAGLLIGMQTALALGGGAFLCYLGYRTFMAAPAAEAANAGGTGLWGAFGSTFVLTLTNPMTVLSFTAIFAGLGLGRTGTDAALPMVAGVFLGSAAWWLLLTSGVSIFRSRVGTAQLRLINRVAGVILAVSGLLALASPFFPSSAG